MENSLSGFMQLISSDPLWKIYWIGVVESLDGLIVEQEGGNSYVLIVSSTGLK